ncbi:MAG: T9SS type A sorting domain-containing protein [Bacteroidota bacterium]|nr:T9SS type A sorting domain-containing protein [Bacteroidota bacterium]
MKKVNVLLLVLLSASCLMAQHSYRPFAVSASSWEIDYRLGPNSHAYGSVSIPAGIGNDTNLGARVYHKVFHDAYGFIGGLREDITLQQVYYYPKDSLQEFLLYDFSKQVGDTIRNVFVSTQIVGENYLYHAVVTSIDSIQLNNIYYYKYILDPYYYNDPLPQALIQVIWYERFGGNYGLVGTIPYQSISIYDRLRCMGVNDSSYLQNSQPLFSPQSCSFILDVPAPETNQLSVFPTCVNDHVELDGFPSANTPYAAELYNSVGACVLKRNISDRLNGLNDLPSGIYLLYISGNNISYTQKLIKQ